LPDGEAFLVEACSERVEVILRAFRPGYSQLKNKQEGILLWREYEICASGNQIDSRPFSRTRRGFIDILTHPKEGDSYGAKQERTPA
jgi:hypothetical protein